MSYLKKNLFTGFCLTVFFVSKLLSSEPFVKLPPPLPILPGDMTYITNRNPVFRWNNRYDVKSYILEIARDKDFKENLIRIENIKPSTKEVMDEKRDYAITHTDYTLTVSDIPNGLVDGQWYWRVGYVDNKDEKSLFSAWKTFTVSSEDKDSISIPSDIKHPYLYFTKADIPALKEKLNRPECRTFKNSLFKRAEQLLKEAPEIPSDEELDKPVGHVNSQHGDYLPLAHTMTGCLEPLGLAYQLTGKVEYAVKARDIMLKLAALKKWTGPHFIDAAHYYSPEWKSALETGVMSAAFATCYDWIYETLDDQERKVLGDALMQKGIKPLATWFDPDIYCEIPRHQMPYRNWIMVCNGGAGVAALSLVNEYPEAKRQVSQVRDRMRAWLNYRGGDYAIRDTGRSLKKDLEYIEPNFDEDGGYVETLGYFTYAIRNSSEYMWTLENVSGYNLFKHIPANVLDPFIYFLYEEGPDGKIITDPKFGDSNEFASPVLMMILAAKTGNRQAQWMLEKIGETRPRHIHSFLAYGAALKAAEPQSGWAKMFSGIGQVVMRSGWGPMQNMLAVKYHQNRGHLDVGTFSLFALGEPLIVDSGCGPYPTRRYREYLSKTPAHNVVMVDSKLQEKTDGSILSFIKTPSLAYCCGELKSAYPEDLKSWKRHTVFVYPDYFVMLDELRGNSPHEYDWLIHNDGEIVLDNDGFKIKNSSANLLVKMAGNDEFAAEKVKVDFPAESKTYDYSKIHPVGKNTDFDFLTILYPCKDEKAMSNVSRIDGVACKGFSVRRGKITDTILYSPSGNIEAGGLAAKGTLALCSTDNDKKIVQFMLIDGVALTLDKQELFSSNIPLICSMSFTTEGGTAVVELPAAANVKIYSPAKVAACFINGHETEFKTEADSVVLNLHSGRNEIFISNKNN